MQEKFIEIIKEYKWQTGLVCVALLVAIVILFSQSAQSQEQVALVPKIETIASSSSANQEKEAVEETLEIIVDVKGAVAKPGLYQLKSGARVNDAVQAAGGFASNADQKSVNLAQKVSDEAVVYVATGEENRSVVSQQDVTNGAQSSSSGFNLVNLNTATEADLQTVTGIGAKRAADIIAYREANGSFKSVDDLNNVSGIGDKTLENIRPYVTVD
ncbi:helix-hairpin-helix domain-containing protein [Streptococcus sp. 20-1249]|uniref:helix-hairpin-helix domain-containing protein n=1 Tax=Streptococcus hepaticus TaxID=3349163 RepID=UPI0037482B9E